LELTIEQTNLRLGVILMIATTFVFAMQDGISRYLAGSASGLSGAMAVAFGAIVATLMGVMLTEENGAYNFLFILLITKLISLISAYYVHTIEASPHRIRK
jgi:sugar phosphate permease